MPPASVRPPSSRRRPQDAGPARPAARTTCPSPRPRSPPRTAAAPAARPTPPAAAPARRTTPSPPPGTSAVRRTEEAGRPPPPGRKPDTPRREVPPPPASAAPTPRRPRRRPARTPASPPVSAAAARRRRRTGSRSNSVPAPPVSGTADSPPSASTAAVLRRIRLTDRPPRPAVAPCAASPHLPDGPRSSSWLPVPPCHDSRGASHFSGLVCSTPGFEHEQSPRRCTRRTNRTKCSPGDGGSRRHSRRNRHGERRGRQPHCGRRAGVCAQCRLRVAVRVRAIEPDRRQPRHGRLRHAPHLLAPGGTT